MIANPQSEYGYLDDVWPTDWRMVCPTCGRFIAAEAVTPVLDVLTGEAWGEDYIRDMADCGRCGRIEVTSRPMRWARAELTQPEETK